MSNEVDEFCGCYLLVCASPKNKGRTYVGFTVDPNRRLNQHNTGKHAGGAWKTSGRGPWKMVLTIHGFPNMVSALQFEWAWQHPDKSRRLKAIHTKHKKLTGFRYKLFILSEMLRANSWRRLPLIIRWLEEEFVSDFPADLTPPLHMPIVYGMVFIRKNTGRRTAISENDETGSSRVTVDSITPSLPICDICLRTIEADVLRCPVPECKMAAHLTCLANRLLVDHPKELLPVSGDCSRCRSRLLWGDLVKTLKADIST